MILEWLMQLSAGFVEWIATLFPTWEIPDALVNADEQFTQVLSWGEGLGAFVDWTAAGLILGFGVLAWFGAIVVRAARSAIGHVPFIGGKG